MTEATPTLRRTGAGTPTTAPTVLIVGAGPTGLTLACDLARRGISFRLIESSPGPQPGSRGKGLQPRTLELFDDLDVGDRVRACGQLAMPMQSTAPDGRVTRGGAVPETLRDRPDIPYPASLITPQWRVEEALRSRLAELGGAVEFSTALESFTQTDDHVSAVVAHHGAAGTAGTVETVTAAWLVGADGGHSRVRAQTGIGFVGETREEVRMVVADVSAEGLDRDAWHIWQHADGLVSLCPLPSTDAFQFQGGIGPGQDPRTGLASMQAILERRSGRRDIRLHTPTWSSLWRANVRLVERYRARRVFLAGDAAHIHSPAGGQGMNTGIQDAVNLGWKLAAVTGGAPPELLDTYEIERRPVAAHVLALSDRRLAQTLREHDVPTRRDASTTGLDIHYRGSVLSHDDRTGAALLRAGDRAPDATALRTVAGVRRLFDLTSGGGFTLLSFAPAAALDTLPAGLRTLHVVTHPTGPGDVADTAGHLAGAYAPTDRTLVLIRPDGYLGLISDAGDATALTRYLTLVAEQRPHRAADHSPVPERTPR